MLWRGPLSGCNGLPCFCLTTVECPMRGCIRADEEARLYHKLKTEVAQGFTVRNRQISHACPYLISEYFYIWVVSARLPTLYDELFSYTDGHSHNTKPTAHQRPVMEHVPEFVLCL